MSNKYVDDLIKRYPEGTRIKLNYMVSRQSVPKGTCGTVQYIDEQGRIRMDWDNGQTLALIEGLDNFEIIKGNKFER